MLYERQTIHEKHMKKLVSESLELDLLLSKNSDLTQKG